MTNYSDRYVRRRKFKRWTQLLAASLLSAVLSAGGVLAIQKIRPTPAPTPTHTNEQPIAELPRFWQHAIVEMRTARPDNRLRVLRVFMQHYDPREHGSIPVQHVPKYLDLLAFSRGQQELAADLLAPHMSPGDVALPNDTREASHGRPERLERLDGVVANRPTDAGTSAPQRVGPRDDACPAATVHAGCFAETDSERLNFAPPLRSAYRTN